MSDKVLFISEKVNDSYEKLMEEIKDPILRDEPSHVAAIKEEVSIIIGDKKKIYRIFVYSIDVDKDLNSEYEVNTNYLSYNYVGWVLKTSLNNCMVCGKEFNKEKKKINCYACGNLVCSDCGENEAIIYELESYGPRNVCIQCFWGQDLVYPTFVSDIHETIPDDQVSIRDPHEVRQDIDVEDEHSLFSVMKNLSRRNVLVEDPGKQVEGNSNNTIKSTINGQAPPLLKGWLRKRGHVVLNWKSRFFVLDSGILSYYLDEAENPPFGTKLKGQICLFNFREEEIPNLINEKEKRNSSDYSEELKKNSLRIYLKRIDSTNAEPEELFIEAESIENKLNWISSIEAHTIYSRAHKNIHNVSLQDTVEVEDGENESRLKSDMSENGFGDVNRFMVFLTSAEKLVLWGLVGKPNPVGIQLTRGLILTSEKRLIYFDPKTVELKGDIVLKPINDDDEFPTATLTNNGRSFSIFVPSLKRTYKFFSKDNINSEMWVEAINSL